MAFTPGHLILQLLGILTVKTTNFYCN